MLPGKTDDMSGSSSVQEVCARVAQILQRERIAQNLSITRLAEGAALSRQGVSYVERGLRIPSLDTLLRISRVLGLDLAEIIKEASRQK